MSVTFEIFSKVAPLVIKANSKTPVMIRGRHGIGKSEFVGQLGRELNLPVVERRCSQMMDAGELVGIPFRDDNICRWCPPDYFYQACNEPVILFLDEIDRGNAEVAMAVMELGDSRKLFGFHLHPGTIFISACNGGKHTNNYQVREMDPAELDRWTVFDLDPTVEEWLKWGVSTDENGRTKVADMIIDFITKNRGHLESTGAGGLFEPNKVYPSRRSWKRFSDSLVENDLLSGTKEEVVGNLPVVYELGMAMLGMEASIAFRDYVQKADFQIEYAEILDAPRKNSPVWKQVEKFAINDHLALVEKMKLDDLWSKDKAFHTDEKRARNLLHWGFMMPSEVLMKLASEIAEGGVMENVGSFHAGEFDGKRMSVHIAEMLNDPDTAKKLLEGDKDEE